MSYQAPRGSFVLSLAAGILMILGGGLSYMWFGRPGFAGMMGGLGLIGVLSGVVVTVGALMLNSRPAERASWGTLILVFSLIGFLGMDSVFIGALLGSIGGVLALTWSPANGEHAP